MLYQHSVTRLAVYSVQALTSDVLSSAALSFSSSLNRLLLPSPFSSARVKRY